MAVRVEILSADADFVTAAFYWPVPPAQQLASAADANRVPAGKRLSAGEQQELKDGTLFETVRTVSVKGFNATQARQRLESLWTELQVEAQAEYTARYRYIGLAYDGAAWS